MRKLSPNKIVKNLRLCGFHACFVGGAVRDFVMDKFPSDWDIATNATPEQVATVFAGTANVEFVGASFGVSLVDGTEVATWRIDCHDGIGDKNCSVKFAGSLEEDLSRRDLTINAMALDGTSIIDPFGGQEDIKAGIIRFVGDPRARIAEDPNRILRACRFICLFDHGRFDINTLWALQDAVKEGMLDHIAPERVRLEILKAMKAEEPSRFFSALDSIGALEVLMPEMAASIGHTGGKHHTETVWEHMMLAGDHCSKRFPLVRLAAFFHDIGKPAVWDGTNFIDHHNVGADIAEKLLKRFKFSTDEIRKVCGLIRVHMREVGRLVGRGASVTPKCLRKNARVFKELGVCYFDFLRVRLADHQGNIAKEPLSFSEIKVLIARMEEPLFEEGAAVSLNQLAINGKDVIALGVPEGRRVGEILRHLFALVEDDPSLNTREGLLSIASTIV